MMLEKSGETWGKMKRFYNASDTKLIQVPAFGSTFGVAIESHSNTSLIETNRSFLILNCFIWVQKSSDQLWS